MEDKLAELRRRLDEKTTEIEAFIAREQGMGDIRAMSPSDYEQLQRDVEELLCRKKSQAFNHNCGSNVSGAHVCAHAEPSQIKSIGEITP